MKRPPFPPAPNQLSGAENGSEQSELRRHSERIRCLKGVQQGREHLQTVFRHDQHGRNTTEPLSYVGFSPLKYPSFLSFATDLCFAFHHLMLLYRCLLLLLLGLGGLGRK